MTAKIIDGKSIADALRADIKKKVADLKTKTGKVPGLAVVLVGENPASQVYVRNKAKQTEEVGMYSVERYLPETTSEKELLSVVKELNADPKIHGILVQLPLPKHISERAVIEAITPEKDVDGFHVINAGKLTTGQNGFVPCTPRGCLMLIKQTLGDFAGKNAVVIGRSNIVGKPMAALLLKEDCTVTIAHAKTQDLPSLCRTADILVVAVGRPNMVKADWIKKGATVIDVGINRLPDGKLCGDVDFAAAKEIAGAITPVPGGVGPMTIACLLNNTLDAFQP